VQEHLMTDNTEEARRQAQQNYLQNPQTPMVTEQSIPNADTRNAYNAEVDRQRKSNG
jgi:hypothetical protein